MSSCDSEVAASCLDENAEVQSQIQSLVDVFEDARHTVVYTGAGISTVRCSELVADGRH